MTYNYIYWGLDILAVKEMERNAQVANIDLQMKQMGTQVSALSLKTSVRKALITGALLLQSEYDSIEAHIKKFDAGIKSKLFIVNNYEELEKLFESEFGVSLKPEPLPETTELKPVEEAIEEVNTPKESLGILEEPLKKSDVSEVVPVVRDFDGELDEFQVEDLQNEVQELRTQVVYLQKALSLAKEGGDSDKLDQLEAKLKLANDNLVKSEQERKHLKQSLRKEQEFISDLQRATHELTNEKLALENKLKEVASGGGLELDSLKLPKNCKALVCSSSLSLANAYKYLLGIEKDAIILDLSRESVMDMLVKIPHPLRITKWLLEGVHLRAIYSKYEVTGVPVAEGVSLVTSPSVVLNDDLFTQADWEACFSQIEETGRPAYLFLGLESHNGVSEFISRLEDNVLVLRDNHPAGKRSYNHVAYKHDNVEEVILP